ETLGGRAYGGDIYECARMLAIAPKETPAALALFFGWAGGEAKKLMRALRIDNKTIGEAARYIEFLPDKISRNPYDIKKALRGFPEKNFFTLLELKKIAFPGDKTELDEIKRAAEKIIKDGECFDLAGLAIKGDELINIGIMEGKPVGEALEALLEAATRDPRLNEKTRLVEMAETIKMNMD
ncbi:MAG: hypothetical protein FWF03_01640, partial [Defluviitaleaceae bacterium]|nr:hypothetical protein [Defluviitaleaceae bacterium]